MRRFSSFCTACTKKTLSAVNGELFYLSFTLLNCFVLAAHKKHVYLPNIFVVCQDKITFQVKSISVCDTSLVCTWYHEQIPQFCPILIPWPPNREKNTLQQPLHLLLKVRTKWKKKVFISAPTPRPAPTSPRQPAAKACWDEPWNRSHGVNSRPSCRSRRQVKVNAKFWCVAVH